MLEINSKSVTTQLIGFLTDTFKNAGFTNAVIAVSGGVDSATSLGLVVQALGPEHVFPLLLPYGVLNQQGMVDATTVCRAFTIPDPHITTIDIELLVDPIIQLDPAMDAVRKGNIMARMRMILLYDAAKKYNALVVGTENKTEHLLGYYTRFGDEASDAEPLRGLYKTQVYEIAKYIGVPEAILAKVPTAGLWEGQTDEGEFGFTYKKADQVLPLFFDERKTVEQIVSAGFELKIVQSIINLAQKNEFKHNLPYLPKSQ